MSTLPKWIEFVTLEELFDWTPYGFLTGCGGTSEYLAYAFKTKPSNLEDFYDISRRGKYFNTGTDIKIFKSNELNDLFNNIEWRLEKYEYARVSFIVDTDEFKDDKNKNDTDFGLLMYNACKNPPRPILFDHSFVITKEGWCYDSYINKYEPRRFKWLNYRQDIIEIFKNPHEKWLQTFGVDCIKDYNLSKTTIHVNN